MISIAMATYNGAQYLSEQIDSILEQTISDLEIIICDDCSTDETCNILQSYEKKDSRIHCFKNETNLGFKKNFEKAISLCKGEFIALSDQDDIWEKKHLEILLNLIGNNDIACGDAELIDGNGNDLHKTLSEEDHFYNCPPKEKIPYRIFYSNGCFQGASMLIKKDFLNSALPFPDSVKYHDVWLSALACFRNGLSYTHTIVTKHRRHDNNVSSSPRWKTFCGIIHCKRFGNFQKDRTFLANEILNRYKGSLTPGQIHLLNHVKMYAKNKTTIWGKIKNPFFRLSHYSDIYTTRKKVFIELDLKKATN